VEYAATFPFAYETSLAAQGFRRVAGVDEAGRGPLAGPVVAAAVIFRERVCPGGIADSKTLTARQREAAFEYITANCEWAVGIVGPEDIDRINILRATHRAMAAALAGLEAPADYALVDGLAVAGLAVPHRPIVRGEFHSASIAAASIVAKVTRDRLMMALHRDYPQYGFDRHKGYGTPEHLRALREHGPCPAHRRSFGPVAQMTLELTTRE
jgi:ribonuclease HII